MGGFYEHPLFSPHTPIIRSETLLAVAVTSVALKFHYISLTQSFGRGPLYGIHSQSIKYFSSFSSCFINEVKIYNYINPYAHEYSHLINVTNARIPPRMTFFHFNGWIL